MLSFSAAKRKYTSTEYKAELKSVCKENRELRDQLESAQKKLKSAESKHNKMLTAHRISLERARAPKKSIATTAATIQSQEHMLQLNEEKTQALVEKAVTEVKDKAKVNTHQHFNLWQYYCTYLII